MREVISHVLPAWERGETAAIATVVHTEMSAPRPPGAAMAVLADGSAFGSVSGGCVESAVYELAKTVMESGEPALQRFGIDDDQAFAAGLTCGGTIDVFVEPVCQHHHPGLDVLAQDVRTETPVAVATVIEHADHDRVGRRIIVHRDTATGGLGSERLDEAVADDARGFLRLGRTGTISYGPDGQRMETGTRVFMQSFQPRPRMIVFGAIDFAAAVAKSSSLLGYHVTVCDARAVFATPARFPTADRVVVDWPHRYLEEQLAHDLVDARSAICVLTHDPKFDVPVLEVALRAEGPTRPGFVGAMGSRRTHADRMARLREAGLTDAQLARLRSPIGLDLGGNTPEETAVSILAEIIAVRSGGTGRPLSATAGPLHFQDESDLSPGRATPGASQQPGTPARATEHG